MGSDFPIKGGLILTQCPELRAELSAGAFWLTWPKVRGCDTKAARNSPLGISFSSSFISQPKVKILAENFVLYLCSLSPLPSFFFPPPHHCNKELFPPGKEWRSSGERKMKEIGFLPSAMLGLWQQIKWQFPRNLWHCFPRNLSAKFPQIPEKSTAQVPLEGEVTPAFPVSSRVKGAFNFSQPD